MAKGAFKAAIKIVGLVISMASMFVKFIVIIIETIIKTLYWVISKSRRELAEKKRKENIEANKKTRERERHEKLAGKSAIANKKEQIKTEISEAKEAYKYRCEERKLLRDHIINKELK
tara:strand:+ start:238 stop:591 length:354 start_codon:yes stop_codon:yes gene_type:complete